MKCIEKSLWVNLKKKGKRDYIFLPICHNKSCYLA